MGLRDVRIRTIDTKNPMTVAFLVCGTVLASGLLNLALLIGDLMLFSVLCLLLALLALPVAAVMSLNPRRLPLDHGQCPMCHGRMQTTAVPEGVADFDAYRSWSVAVNTRTRHKTQKAKKKAKSKTAKRKASAAKPAMAAHQAPAGLLTAAYRDPDAIALPDQSFDSPVQDTAPEPSLPAAVRVA